MKITIKKTASKKMMCGGKPKKMEMGGMAGPGNGILKKDKNRCWDGKGGKLCKSTNVPSSRKKVTVTREKADIKKGTPKIKTGKSTIFGIPPKTKKGTTKPKFDSYM